MASKFERRRIIWTITNFTRPVINSYGHSSAVATDSFEINLNEETYKCFLELQPNSYDQTIQLTIWNSDLIFSYNKYSFQLNDQTVKYVKLCKSSQYDNVSISHEELFDENNKYIHSNNNSLILKLNMLLYDYNFEDEQREEKLTKADSQYFNSSTFSDFKIVCRDGVIIPAHRIVLSRLPVLAAMLKSDMIESRTNELKVEDIDGAVMFEVLHFLYTGRAENLDELAVEILYAANKYNVPRLKKKCAIALIPQITITNVLQTLAIADHYNEMYITKRCLIVINRHYDKLRASEDWKNLRPDLAAKIHSMFQIPDIVITTQLENQKKKIKLAP